MTDIFDAASILFSCNSDMGLRTVRTPRATVRFGRLGRIVRRCATCPAQAQSRSVRRHHAPGMPNRNCVADTCIVSDASLGTLFYVVCAHISADIETILTALKLLTVLSRWAMRTLPCPRKALTRSLALPATHRWYRRCSKPQSGGFGKIASVSPQRSLICGANKRAAWRNPLQEAFRAAQDKTRKI